jgi:hypothetical protein
MSTPALHPPHRLRPARVIAYGGFAIMLAGWVMFAYALIAELAVWLAGFPFLLGLAIWDASWSEPARLILIVVVAGVYLFLFRPREAAQ